MATATTVPRWVHILLQGYRWGHTSLPNIRGQAGVLMAVHKDVLAGTEAHVPAQPPEAQGYIYQMEIQRPESAPLMITGVYLPTGTGAIPRSQHSSYRPGQGAATRHTSNGPKKDQTSVTR
jgi:hypothetical protein